MTHGWIIIDKPKGMSSAHVVAKIKRLFKVKKAGHGGTLDPLATGVLPIALGEATKTLSYVLDGKKAYSFEVTWGEARSTEDREGEITATSDKRPTSQEIEKILPLFTGHIEQVPPAYSALKINGKRAYALARQGEEVLLAPRQVKIDSLTLLKTPSDFANLAPLNTQKTKCHAELVSASHRSRNKFGMTTGLLETSSFEVICSKGTYVRSLARDLALRLGTYGHISGLRRLMAGPFQEKDAILLDSLLEIGHNTELIKYVLPLQDALVDILALEVQGVEAAKLRQGQVISFVHKGTEEVALILCEGVPQALTKIREGCVTPIRVFNME